jgi:large subunit ribosomal protein L10
MQSMGYGLSFGMGLTGYGMFAKTRSIQSATRPGFSYQGKLAITRRTEISVDRAQKAAAVEKLHATFKEAETIVVTRYTGMTAGQVSDLRVKMRAEGVSYRVSKNRLALRALKGTRFESIGPMLKGPVGLATSKDPISASRIAYNFSKDNDKLVIVGGALGEKVLDKSSIEMLSKLPSLNELRSRLLGMLQTPATRLATLSQAPASQLARVIQAYANKT